MLINEVSKKYKLSVRTLPDYQYRILQNETVLLVRTLNNTLSFSAQVEQIITHLKSILL